MSIIIPYNPALRKYFKNIIACLIFQQLLYWTNKITSEHSSFYKFVEPCKHPLYRQGDSWCEEIGISKKEFKNARLECITHYHSKESLIKANQEGDPFKGNPFCSYVDKQNHLTHYKPNWPKIKEILQSIDQQQFMQDTKGTFPEGTKGTFAKVPKGLSPRYQRDFRSIQKITQENIQKITHFASSVDDVCFNSNKVQSGQILKSRKKRKASESNPANDEPFSKLCEIWPKQERMFEARQCFDKKATSPEIAQKIIEGAQARVDDWRKKRTDMQFIMQLPNWLRGECWNDKIPPSAEVLNISTSAAEQRKEANKRKAELEIENLMRQHNLNNGNKLS